MASGSTDATGTPRSDTSPTTLYEVLGGEVAIRRLVDAFYDRMDHEECYAVLRALHPADLAGSRDKLFWFLCGWSGGPNYFVERFGHPRLRARHLPYAIGVNERDQWLSCMQQALTDVQVDAVLSDRLLAAFFQTADWMRNRPESASGG
jgi:hemoglobin